MHRHLSQVPRLLSLQVVQALLPRQFVSTQDPSICYGCVTWCLGSRSPCGHTWGLWDQASFGDDCQLWIWKGSSDTKVAPTVVQQQQRQEDRHPLLLDAPVSHGELAQGMCKQALQSKWPVTLCWALLPSRASLTPAGQHQAGSTESLVRVATEVPPAVGDSQDRVRYVTCCFHEAVNSLQTESMSTPCISAWAASVRPVPTWRLAGLPRAQAHLQVTYPAGQLTEGTMY